MAFKIVPNEDVSMFLRPNDVTTKSFLSGRDPEPVFAAPMPPGQSIRRVIDFSRMENDEVEEESTALPPPSSKDMVRVFLRIKPRTEEESHYYSIASSNQDDSLITDKKATVLDPSVSSVGIESEYQIAITAPPDSAAYKNSINGHGKLTHRFTFTKILPGSTEQPGLFNEIVKPRLEDFMEGRNQLLFTYGATSSGKTFTIQGDSRRPGIIPRALDVLFNSVGPRHISEDELNIKPLGYNRVGALLPREKEKATAEKKSIIEMGVVLNQESLDGTASSDDTQTSIASLRSRYRDEGLIDINERSLHYAIWVSFAEIYNENIYDLFEKMPEVKNKGDKPRRPPLKLADDKGGWVYIKGLKEVPVSTADEAYQLLLIGRQNLRFAATKLNHNSSRSHCIFTIKMVRIADKDRPHMARVSMLSFCDLAGSERIKKTMNTGERQKEAGNINTSLLVLGRCIKAIRHNQMIKDARKHQIIPYRDSKLTRLFQSYFTGSGKVSMIVNISQSSYLFDETLQVLKFSAIASKVHIQQIKEPKPVQVKKAAAEKAKRKTRFSIMVENNKNVGRGSIAWENPQFRSTMCHRPDSDRIIDEEEDEYADVTNVAEETVIDTKYDGLLKLIDNLKNQLIEEKQKNLKLETEIRTELCDEFNKMMVDIETSWEQRLQEEKDRASELSDWRIGKLEEALRENQKKNRLESESSRRSEQTDLAIQEKTNEIADLKEELSVIKKLHSTQLDENKKAEEEVTSLKSKLKDLDKTKTSLNDKVEALQKELDSTNEALKSQNSDPKILELETMVKEFRQGKEEDDKQIKDLKALLDEAGEDYLAKDEQIKGLQNKLSNSKKIIDEKEEQIQDLDKEGDELKALLSQATSRADEKELLIFEMEEKLETLNVQLEEYKSDEEVKWSTKKASDQQISNLNDEIENLKNDKKKMRALVDTRDADLASKDKEIENLERETKSVIKMKTSLEIELQELRKQLNNTSSLAADTEKSLKEKSSMIDNLQVALDARKKEDTAIEALTSELDVKRKESEELQFKVKELQAEVEAKEYDTKRAKDNRDELMSHYEQEIKKMNEKLALERRETAKLREVMQNTTPRKIDSSSEKELTMLREEVAKKSEFIKTLAAKVTTPKRKSSEEDQSCCADLKAELENLKTKHAKDLEKQQSRHEKVIEEFKDTNAELLKHVPASASKRVMNTKRTVEDSEDENIPPTSNADHSTIEATPGVVSRRNKRGRSKKGRSKLSATTQVSFDDEDTSIGASYHLEDSSTSVTESDVSKAKRPKRGARVSKAAQQSRKNSSKNRDADSSTVHAVTFSIAEPLANSPQKLDSITGQTLSQSQFQTPATNRKRKLFTLTPRADAFTPDNDDNGPVESPHTLVKRQLRSRNIKLKH